jgi:4'-phosphopantetheinyl transferase
MGLLIKQYIEDDCVLGIWEVKEDYDYLFSRLSLLPEEIKTLNSFQNHLRSIEWLSVRVLLKEIAGKSLSVYYNGNRKPFIRGNSYNVSISHSRDFTSVLLSKKRKVGIDLEYMSHRISNIESKFINENEVITRNNSRNIIYIYTGVQKRLYIKFVISRILILRKTLLLNRLYQKKRDLSTGG